MSDKEGSSFTNGSGVNTPKKRGRPAILKEYSDPMKSPMAQSSLQMQKSHQSFNKPLMRVGSSGSPTKFKTPQKKRRSSSTEVSPPHSATGSTKKGRYRGVVMNSSTSPRGKSSGLMKSKGDDVDSNATTPSKNNDQKARMQVTTSFDHDHEHDHDSSSPGTPLDQVFSSISRAHNVKSSPPVMFDTDSPIPTKRKLSVEMRETSCMEDNSSITKRWKFMLNVGRDGKACIETNSLTITENANSETSNNKNLLPPKHLLQNAAKAADVDTNGVAKFDKKRVMGFLRQMKSKNKTLDAKPLPEQTKKFNIPSSPSAPPNSMGNLAEPLTPKCSQLMQFKTGLTPSFNIDELLVSPRLHDSLSRNLFKSPSQYVFKVSSGDPLLINDHQEMDMMNSHSQEVSDILSFLNSPKRGTNLNTPPSYLVNFSSPRSNGKPQNAAPSTSNMKLNLPPLGTPKTEPNHQTTLLPSTPLLKLGNLGPPSQFTPIIQKQMSDESKFSLTQSIHPINLRKEPARKLESSDDARMALKRLINGN